jgi:hypothetical protein
LRGNHGASCHAAYTTVSAASLLIWERLRTAANDGSKGQKAGKTHFQESPARRHVRPSRGAPTHLGCYELLIGHSTHLGVEGGGPRACTGWASLVSVATSHRCVRSWQHLRPQNAFRTVLKCGNYTFSMHRINGGLVEDPVAMEEVVGASDHGDRFFYSFLARHRGLNSFE